MRDPVGPAQVETAVWAATSGSPDLAERLRSVFGVLVEFERPGLRHLRRDGGERCVRQPPASGRGAGDAARPVHLRGEVYPGAETDSWVYANAGRPGSRRARDGLARPRRGLRALRRAGAAWRESVPTWRPPAAGRRPTSASPPPCARAATTSLSPRHRWPQHRPGGARPARDADLTVARLRPCPHLRRLPADGRGRDD